MAILEGAGAISNIYSVDGKEFLGVGTVAAGYQNFFICIEMFVASIALRFAFPHSRYQDIPTTQGRTVSLQSISSNLKETMNPKDIMQDAVHNFHPHYQQYTQHSQQSYEDQQIEAEQDRRYQQTNGNVSSNLGQPHGVQQPNRSAKYRQNEKTTLLSSDDEFQ